MRNTLEYPPTKDEIIEALERLLKQETDRIAENGAIGNMTPLLISEAITRIREDTTFSIRRSASNGKVVVVRSGLRRKHALQLYDLHSKRNPDHVYYVLAELGEKADD